MSEEEHLRLASMGGKAAAASPNRHRFSSEAAKAAGRKGGLKTSADKAHMSKIGKLGGELISQDLEHMSTIGKLGGRAVSHEHMIRIGKLGNAAKKKVAR